MSVLKFKNSNGEWETLPTKYFVLKAEVEERLKAIEQRLDDLEQNNLT